MRREAIVGERFPVRQACYHAVGKLPDFIIQTQGVLHIGGYQYHRAAVALGHFSHQSGAGRAGQFAKLALIAGFNRQRVSVLFRHRRYHDLLRIRSADMEGNSLIFNSLIIRDRPGFANPYRKGHVTDENVTNSDKRKVK